MVVSGGNIDMYILDQIVAKGLEREHRLLRVRITLSDKPGALSDILAVVAQARANVVSVEHERVGRDVPIGRAEVTLNLETQNMEHTKSLVSALGEGAAEVQADQLGQAGEVGSGSFEWRFV